MAISLFGLVFGALETGGAVQELVYRGILNSETEPMIIGGLGHRHRSCTALGQR
ncbi:MAG: hypothetical protein WB558_18630 [Terriglobales bacterium]